MPDLVASANRPLFAERRREDHEFAVRRAIDPIARAVAQNAGHRTDTNRFPGHRPPKQWASMALTDEADRFL